MTRKKTTTAPEVTRTTLVVPLDGAREKISLQIEEGSVLLETQIENHGQLSEVQAKYEIWFDYTRELLKQIANTDELWGEFHRRVGTMSISRRPPSFQQKVDGFLTRSRGDLQRLISIHERLELFPVTVTERRQESPSPIETIELIIQRFHIVARRLRRRHNNRTTLDVNDEYDVQDLLYALLSIFFDDIRDEECTPSYAGGSSRMDFLLKAKRTVIEVKKTRSGLGDKEIGSQLIEDIGRYQAHPDCQTLVCFVYDPEGRIRNPVGLERDLGRMVDGMTVKVIVAPKG